MFEILESYVLDWAADKGLTGDISIMAKRAQCLKTLSEAGELADAVVKDNYDEVVDAIGDVAVTLVILADLYGTNVLDCLEHAFNEVRNRKGVTINGVFIKDAEAGC